MEIVPIPDEGRRSVLVTGATGAIGPSVVRALADANYHVRVFCRKRPPDDLLPAGIEIVTGNIVDRSAAEAAVQDVDAVVHLAGLLHIIDGAESLREEYERINVEGTDVLVQASLRARVRQFVFISSIAVYGYGGAEVLSEDSPTRPTTPYGESKLRAEQIVLNARREGEPALGTVLRLAAVYGSRVKGNYRRLLRSLSQRTFVPVGAGQNRRTLVHDSDVARAVVLALNSPNAAGRIFNVSDGRFHLLNDIIAAICDSLGRARPTISLPLGPVRMFAGLLEDFQRLAGLEPKIARSTIDKYTEEVAVDSSRIQSELGFVPRMGLAAGWKQTIEEMRQRGEL
jgi:nucleoside-diphosphate-sugar epimerase